MHNIGIDIIEITRIEKAIARWGEGFLHRVYTDSELKLCRRQPASLAARFAGKEAIMKALRAPNKSIAAWKEIEILSNPDGTPLVRLYGKAWNQANYLGLTGFAISLSHSKEYALAFAAGEAKYPPIEGSSK